MKRLSTALKAVSYLPPSAIWGHAARRLRNNLVPVAPEVYRGRLQQAANALPRFVAAEPAVRLATVTSAYFRAKHAKNATSCLSGKFTFLNKTIDFGGLDAVDWMVKGDEGNHQLWRSNLGFMGYLSAAAERDPEAALACGVQLARSFLALADFSNAKHFGDLWHPYGASQRSLALATTLIAIPPALRSTPEWAELEAFLRLNIAFVMRNLETELGLNHLERNLSAIALYALGAASIAPDAQRLLRRHAPPVLRASIGSDGVQLERSAMYQALTIQSLHIFEALPFWSPVEQRWLRDTRISTQRALGALTLGDGLPVMFNDAWMGETPTSAEILPEGPPGFTVLPEGKYVRLTDGDAVVVFDAGPIGVDSNPGHGHADFLAIEATVGQFRLIVDPGTYSYTIGADGGALRHELRSWQAHNGPAFLEGRPVEFRGSFKVGRRAAAELREASEDGEAQFALGSLGFDDFSVERQVRLSPGEMQIEDRWLHGTGTRRTRFLIPQDWRLDAWVGRLSLAQADRTIVFSWSSDVELNVGAAQWSPSYNVMAPAHELLFSPSGEVARIDIHWNNGKARPIAASAPATPRKSSRSIDSILAFPRSQAEGSARYNALLYDAMEQMGVTIKEYRRFFLAQPGASLFHFHWPDRVFGGLAKLQETIGDHGIKRLRRTMKAYRELGRPVVWTVHNVRPHDFRTPRYERLYQEFEADLMSDVSGFIFLSQFSQDTFLAEHPEISPGQCAVIPHMLTPISVPLDASNAPPELAALPQGGRFFLTPGHIRRYKNIETSLALFDKVKEANQFFVIAGPPTDASYVDAIKASFASRSDVLLLDRILREPEMNWCYQNAIAVFSIRSVDSNSGVLFSTISNGGRVLVNPGPVSEEISGMVGPGWIIQADADAARLKRALAKLPPAPAQTAWGDPEVIARAHLEFMQNL